MDISLLFLPLKSLFSLLIVMGSKSGRGAKEILLSTVALRDALRLWPELLGEVDDDVLAAHPPLSFRRLRYSERLTCKGWYSLLPLAATTLEVQITSQGYLK